MNASSSQRRCGSQAFVSLVEKITHVLGRGGGLRHWALGALYVLFASHWAWGTPSGLNNIPTTDVTPTNILVLQTWANVADDQHPEEFIGFKYGAFDGLEVGLDWKANSDPHAHVALQVKYAFDIEGDVWRGVAGVANVSDSRKHTGEVFPYLATSYDFGEFRAHLGFTAQSDNEGFFAGVDKTLLYYGRDLQLKADLIQVNHMEDVLYSAGFLYNLRRRRDADSEESSPSDIWYAFTRNFVVESWVTLPTTTHDEVLTMKLNYVIEF